MSGQGLRVILLSFLLLLGSCGKVVPPGMTVIVLSTDGTSEIHTQGLYKATGRDRAYFVDSRLASFTESMDILCADDVNMSVDVKWIGSFQVTKDKIDIIKSKVPAKKVDRDDISGFELSLISFYKIAIKDIVRANTRSIVSAYRTDNIRVNRAKIEAQLKSRILKKLNSLNYPVTTSDIMISNLDYDKVITAQRTAIKKAELDDKLKAAEAKAKIAQYRRSKEIEMVKGAALIAAAQAKAKANRILSASLTKAILTLRQYEVLEKMAQGTNNQLIVVPYQALGSTLKPAYDRMK